MPYVCIYNKSATRNYSKCLSLAECVSLYLSVCVYVALNYEPACFEKDSAHNLAAWQ